MIRGLVDTDDLPGSLARIMANESSFTREPIAQQLALVMQQIVGGGGVTGGVGAAVGVEEAPLDGRLYGRQSAGRSTIEAPWSGCTYPPGCSGNLYARKIAGAQFSTLQVIGQASTATSWDGSYSFILAYLPSGLAPGADRFALVPSSATPGTPDSISGAWIKPTGEIAIAFIYEKGPNPNIAWFDGIEFLLA